MKNRKRIKRLKNRIRRTEKRLDACAAIKRLPIADTDRLLDIVRGCDRVGYTFEALVSDVEDKLDDLIEPRNPLLEMLSDVGIDIAAVAAVSIYRGTRSRLQKRLARDQLTLHRLQGAGS